MKPPRAGLVERIADFFSEHPTAALTTREAVAKFGGTQHSVQQAMYEARKRGVSVRSERVYRLRVR